MYFNASLKKILEISETDANWAKSNIFPEKAAIFRNTTP